jgi:hypothetical protein
MAGTPVRGGTDPNQVQVQIAFRVPFWYREQLIKEASKHSVSVTQLVTAAVKSVIKPIAPK